jgi:hypothetical protein
MEDRLVPFPVEEGQYGQILALAHKVLWSLFEPEGTLSRSRSPRRGRSGTLVAYDLTTRERVTRATNVDGTSVTEPTVAFWFQDVGWGVKNYGTDPDIVVEYPPEAYRAGEDPQRDRAIAEALAELEARACRATAQQGAGSVAVSPVMAIPARSGTDRRMTAGPLGCAGSNGRARSRVQHTHLAPRRATSPLSSPAPLGWTGEARSGRAHPRDRCAPPTTAGRGDGIGRGQDRPSTPAWVPCAAGGVLGEGGPVE